jgi:predicted nucleic acid-binding protein
MLLDTNIVIDACKPAGAWLSPWTRHPEAACASVTRVEALGFAGISVNEDELIYQATARRGNSPDLTTQRLHHRA